MKNQIPEKNYLSASRFAHSVDCGAHGWSLANPTENKTTIPLSVFERGSFFHNEIENFYYGNGIVSSVIPGSLFFKIPPKSEVVPIKEEVKLVALPDGSLLKCMGFPDIPAKGHVIELKSGDHKEWHKWQLAFYIWLMDLPKGKLVYFDSDLEIEITKDDETYRVTDELVVEVWLKTLARTEIRSKECSGCNLKKTCSLWKGLVSDDMIDLVDLKEQVKELTLQKDTINKMFLESISTQLKQATEKFETLKEKVISESEVNNYSLPSYRIRIQETTKTVLPQDFVIPTYQERPELYKPPEPKTKDLNKEFGIKVKEKMAVIESLEESED